MVQQKHDDRKSSPREKPVNLFSYGFEWKYLERKRAEIFKDVLTQNSLDAIFAKAELLIPDWMLDLNSSSVKFESLDLKTWAPGARLGLGHITSPQMNCWLEPGQARLSCKSGPVLRNSQRLCWWARAQGSGGQNGIILGQALTWSIEVVRAIPLITLITHQDKILTLSGGAICGPIKHHLQLECACYSTWRS